MTRTSWYGLPLLFAAACGTTTTSPPDMAMQVKSPPVWLGTEKPDSTKPADYKSCKADPAGPAKETEVSGTVKDFQDDQLVAGARMKVFKTVADVPNTPIAMATSDKDGKFTIKIPGGAPYRLIWSNEGGKALKDGVPTFETIPTYEFNQRFDDKERISVKVSTREAIPGLVSVIPDEKLGVLAGSVRDCNGKEVGGARVKVSGTAAAYDSDTYTFYFTKVGDSTLPTRTQKWTSGANGSFAALNVPAPGLGTITATGVVDSGEPKVLGTATVPLQPGAITIVEVIPSGPL